MKLITNENCSCPTFRIMECSFEDKYIVIDFNKFEINLIKRSVKVGIVGSDDMVKLASLKPYYDTATDRGHLDNVKNEYDKIILEHTSKCKKKEKENSKNRKGQVVF